MDLLNLKHKQYLALIASVLIIPGTALAITEDINSFQLGISPLSTDSTTMEGGLTPMEGMNVPQVTHIPPVEVEVDPPDEGDDGGDGDAGGGDDSGSDDGGTNGGDDDGSDDGGETGGDTGGSNTGGGGGGGGGSRGGGTGEGGGTGDGSGDTGGGGGTGGGGSTERSTSGGSNTSGTGGGGAGGTGGGSTGGGTPTSGTGGGGGGDSRSGAGGGEQSTASNTPSGEAAEPPDVGVAVGAPTNPFTASLFAPEQPTDVEQFTFRQGDNFFVFIDYESPRPDRSQLALTAGLLTTLTQAGAPMTLGLLALLGVGVFIARRRKLKPRPSAWYDIPNPPEM